MSLAIASSIMLLVVSSVVAFNGWPDNLNGTTEPEVAALSDPSNASGGSASLAAVALPQAVTPSASARAKAEREGGSRTGTTRGDESATSTQTSGGQSATVHAVPADHSLATSDSGITAKADPVEQVGDAVRDTTGAVADVVAPVAPSGGSALESVGAAGADTVEQVGGTVQLLP